VSILFDPHDGRHDDLPLTLLWQQGEPLDTALERLSAIPADPAAGRATRDAMLPCFEGLDKWLPRYMREETVDLINNRLITVEQIILTDAEPRDPSIRDYVNRRWSPNSPLRRAAHAALAHLESHGADIHAVRLHGEDIDNPTTPSFVGFQLRRLRAALGCFRQYGGEQWLEVVHPTGKGQLRTLQIRPKDREKLSQYSPPQNSFFR
jgi:hypothetical protein